MAEKDLQRHNPHQHHRQAGGIWQLQKTLPIENDMGKVANDIYTFSYDPDDGTITLRLLTLHPGQWKSKDDFYKLSAKWEGNTLYYLPPFGDWTELAVFENNRFVNVGNGMQRIFEKIPEDKVVGWNKDILKPRELHDYRIQPDGSLKG